MLMKVKTVDFHAVEAAHHVIHDRLTNWSRWVTPRGAPWMGPIWRLGKSNGRQWDEPELRPAVKILDAMEVEKAVSRLPVKQRAAVRWAYVFKTAPARPCRELAVNMEGLEALVRSGRAMLKNTV